MRFEESGCEVRIVKPVAERVGERQGLLRASVLIGIPGTLASITGWASMGAQAPTPVLAFGAALSSISAWMFWKSERMQDEVWTLVLNRESKTVERAGRAVARFDEVCTVRCTTIENSHHILTLVVQRGRGFYDILLCDIAGTPSDHAVFEAASVSVAEALGVRQESRSYDSPLVSQLR